MPGESNEEETTHLGFEPKPLVSLYKKKNNNDYKKALSKNRSIKQDGIKLFANCNILLVLQLRYRNNDSH